MTTAIESGIGTLNYGKQPAKGTPATAATTTVGYDRPKWFDGALGVAKKLSSEEYTDGNRFGSPTTFVDTVGGDVGSLVHQAQPENVGLRFAQTLGVDTVTGVSDPYTHTITSAGTSGAWGTWWAKVGAAVGPVRQMFSDCKTKKLAFMVGRDQKTMHLTEDIVSLNPGEVYASDPAKAENASDPYLWTEGTGAVTFDGTVDSEAHEETLEIDTGAQAYWGEDIKPCQIIEKKGTIVSAVKTIVTDATLLKYYKAIYGKTNPVAGDKPVKDVLYAAFTTLYSRSATRTLSISRPYIAVDPAEMVVGAQREGGPIEISFGGACLKNGGSPALTVVVLSAESTSYA